MLKNYTSKSLSLLLIIVLIIGVASCKKDKGSSQITPTLATPVKLGLYEPGFDTVKNLFMQVTNVGTKALSSYLQFDTGSGGMVLDASEVLSPSMLTSSGFNFTGDSTVVNGITITNQSSTIVYGADANSSITVHGNLAYANVTLGETSAHIIVKRLPFFLYYKAVDNKGNKSAAGEFDILGVSPQTDVTFSNGVAITSPFSYYDPGNGLTRGFKLAALGTSHFAADGPYVPDVLTIGLTQADLSPSSGFTITSVNRYPSYGYVPIIPTTIVYNGKSITSNAIFDTGTNAFNYIEDKTLTGNITKLPQNSQVSVTTAAGFSYSYTTGVSNNLTYVENPATAGGSVTIFSIYFFINNEYLLDYTGHQIGLKNN